MIRCRSFIKGIICSLFMTFGLLPMGTANPPLGDGILHDPLMATVLGFATYGATDYAFTTSQLAMHGEENLTVQMEHSIRRQLQVCGVETVGLHIKKMNKVTQQTTPFPGIYVTRDALFIDDTFFAKYCKGGANGVLNNTTPTRFNR